MKKILFVIAITTVLWSCKTTSTYISPSTKEAVQANINLIDIKDDKVLVNIKSPKISTDEITYGIPKTVPGTYSEDNFGKYIDDFKAFDANGNLLPVSKTDQNTWNIKKAKSLDRISYLVNDTFDTESGKGFGKEDIFSPTGTNIDEGKNFMVNMHGFVGYFQNKMSIPYIVTITHPASLWGATSMIDEDSSTTIDLFTASRYAILVENPVMYAKPDYTTFTVGDMEIQICVYSPTGKVTAESITPEMKTMMTAQKTFLGSINSTKKYSVLLYLTTMKKNDAKGTGALEHPSATTVVLPESFSKKLLLEQMKDIVSHEFFHILTPLTIHSQEIQNFDYNAPKMSEHLWMYEGVTEYFANLFQINQGLITEDAFYTRIANQISRANTMNDTMPFTTMSKNVLLDPYKDQYTNVYQKGALIGMCLDIIIREKSDGKRGILDLMKKLSKEYGVSKAFNDDELFTKITKLTYPEVGSFLSTYVSGPTPIPYEFYLAKMGVTNSTKKIPESIFGSYKNRNIKVNTDTKEIYVKPNIELNVFFTNLGLKGGDTIVAINDKPYSAESMYDLMTESKNWNENDTITVKIKRDGKEQIVKGTVKLSYIDNEVFGATDTTKSVLKDSWLKG